MAEPEPTPMGNFLPTIAEVCEQQGAQTNGWRVPANLAPGTWWINLDHAHARMPTQGWKLHVSAGLASAREVLRRALRVLFQEDAHFKIAASMARLAALNRGAVGLPQIGKFITVYPNDEAQAIRLALALDAGTRGLRGPDIPSDRPLRPGSLVHYRYGGFDRVPFQTPGYPILFAIKSPGGELVQDVCETSFHPPDWAIDPFIAAGVAVDLPRPDPLLAGRYLVMGQLHESARGAIFWAVDLTVPCRCILKRAPRDAMMELDGRDARDRLRREAEALNRLIPDPRFPALVELFEQEDDLYLAMEDVPGIALDRHIAQIYGSGRTIPGEQVAAWGRELAGMLQALHRQGLIDRDVKGSNVIVMPDGRLRLIDFDICHIADRGHSFPRFGTPGYISPQQARGEMPSVADDVFSLGAVLYLAATGADPAAALCPSNLLDRPIASMNPAIGPDLAGIIARCLHPETANRFTSMAELDAGLAVLGPAACTTPPPFGGEQVHEPEDEARRKYRDMARGLGDRLCITLTSDEFTANYTGGLVQHDLYMGLAGILLALSEIASELDEPRHRIALTVGARRVAELPPVGGPQIGGLYIGQAGIAAALLRAGQVLCDAHLIAEAAQRGRRIASLPFAGPDLMNGAAGLARFHLWLWDETRDAEHLQHAVAAGQHLLANAEGASADGLCWPLELIPGNPRRNVYPGYAHGTAGIGDVLLDLYEATQDERFCTAAEGAAHALAGLAVPALSDNSGLNWGRVQGGPPTHPFWCHGAAGVGEFWLHAAQLGLLAGASDLAARAARTVGRGSRWAGISQCHGLAGNIEFLLDMHQWTDETAYLTEARSLACLMLAQIGNHSELSQLVDNDLVSDDYMLGLAGVAVCLLRLSAPERLPHQLSRRGFQYKPLEERR